MNLSQEKLMELAESANPGPYVHEMAKELLVLRADHERMNWLSLHIVSVHNAEGLVFGHSPQATESLREYIDLTMMVIP